MSSAQKSCASTLSLTDIMENGFLIVDSTHSISPGSSFLEMTHISKPDAWDSASNLMTGSLLALKVTESSLNNVKGDLQASRDSVVSFCKTPLQPCAFDFSNVNSTNSKANSIPDVFCDTKSSTPCKEDEPSKLAENVVLKCSEMNDLPVFKKPLSPPILEISRIHSTLNSTLSLDATLEEGSLDAMKPETPSLEVLHFAVPQAGSGVSAVKYQSTTL